MSGFHEIATLLRMQEERSLLMENHAYRVDTDGHRSGIGNRQFGYLDQVTEKKTDIDLSILPGRKTDKKSGA